MPGFLYQWPLWIVFILMFVFFVGLSQLGLVLVRQRLGRVLQVGDRDAHFVSVMISSMMIFYGLVAALIAVNVYEKYSDVNKLVSREAAAISALYRDSMGYPEPTRSAMGGAIRDYTQQIIHEAWPQQKRGLIPTGGVALVTRIEEILFAFEPASEGQKILHVETFQAFNEMAVARRLRVDANRERLPDAMWGVLIFGALLCLFAASFFEVPSARLQYFMQGLLAVLFAIVLFVTFVWDRPYLGEAGIDAGTYELVYEQLMKP
jgi:hypothetical protein